jgi:hypothetical protein
LAVARPTYRPLLSGQRHAIALQAERAQLAAISAHPAAMVGTGMPKLRGRTGNEAIVMPTAPSLERDSAPGGGPLEIRRSITSGTAASSRSRSGGTFLNRVCIMGTPEHLFCCFCRGRGSGVTRVGWSDRFLMAAAPRAQLCQTLRCARGTISGLPRH